MEKQEKNMNMLAEERTLLAAERTFAAWLRTALSAMAGGIAFLRFFIFKTDLHRVIAHIIAVGLIVWGCLVVVVSFMDYKAMSSTLVNAKNYKSSQLKLLIMIVPLFIISILLLWIALS